MSDIDAACRLLVKARALIKNSYPDIAEEILAIRDLLIDDYNSGRK